MRVFVLLRSQAISNLDFCYYRKTGLDMKKNGLDMRKKKSGLMKIRIITIRTTGMKATEKRKHIMSTLHVATLLYNTPLLLCNCSTDALRFGVERI